MLVFANSSPSATEVGVYYRGVFSSFSIPTPTDLVAASTLSLGNSASGTAPVRLLKRMELHIGATYTASSSPYSLSDILLGKRVLMIAQPCLTLTGGYFCEEAFVYYKMNPSYLDQEEVTDISGSGFHAVNGIDNSPN